MISTESLTSLHAFMENFVKYNLESCLTLLTMLYNSIHLDKLLKYTFSVLKIWHIIFIFFTISAFIKCILLLSLDINTFFSYDRINLKDAKYIAENALWCKVGKFMTHGHIYDYHWQWNAWNTVLQICPLGRKYMYMNTLPAFKIQHMTITEINA